MLEERKLKDLPSSNVYNDSKFLLGKDLSENVKEELTRYITDLQGYFIIDIVTYFGFVNCYFFKIIVTLFPKGDLV